MSVSQRERESESERERSGGGEEEAKNSFSRSRHQFFSALSVDAKIEFQLGRLLDFLLITVHQHTHTHTFREPRMFYSMSSFLPKNYAIFTCFRAFLFAITINSIQSLTTNRWRLAVSFPRQHQTNQRKGGVFPGKNSPCPLCVPFRFVFRDSVPRWWYTIYVERS